MGLPIYVYVTLSVSCILYGLIELTIAHEILMQTNDITEVVRTITN